MVLPPLVLRHLLLESLLDVEGSFVVATRSRVIVGSRGGAEPVVPGQLRGCCAVVQWCRVDAVLIGAVEMEDCVV